MSRNGVDHARRYADLVAAIAALPAPTLVIDGERTVCVRIRSTLANPRLPSG